MGSNSLPMLKECCCGCSLKTGSMIIGYISLLSSIILTCVAVYSLLHDKFVIMKDDSSIDAVLQMFILSVRVVQIFGSLLLIIATHRVLCKRSPNPKAELRSLLYLTDVSLFVVLKLHDHLELFLEIIMDAFLHQLEQAMLVIPWMTVALVVVVLEGSSLIVMFCHLAIGEYNKRVFSMTTHVSVTIYFIFVVFSYYRELKNKASSSNRA